MKKKSRRGCLWLLAAGSLLLAGCGGIRGNYQASPASLLILKQPVSVPVPVAAAGGLAKSFPTVD